MKKYKNIYLDLIYLLSIHSSKYNRFVLDEMPWINASKFAIFLEYKYIDSFFLVFFFHFMHRLGHLLGKNKVVGNKRKP